MFDALVSPAGLRRLVFALAGFSAVSASADEFRYKDRLLSGLVRRVPAILKTFNPKTGRFGTGVWICTDQNEIYPLAVAYAYKAEGNPFFKDPRLLEAVVKGGDALIADADAEGCWVFRKKDGSTWGKIRMPWTYSRWVRAFSLIRDDMPADRRAAWEKALTLGYEKIAAKDMGRIHNIPTHHAMGLYLAGRLLERPDWRARAEEQLRKTAAAQAEGGYWPEGTDGPVVNYNYVYIEALGIYHVLSGDREVLPAIERGIRFHRMFTYPDGRPVETLDGRNPFHDTIHPGNIGFTLSPEGRAYLQRQWDRLGWDALDEDNISTLLLYGAEGPPSRSISSSAPENAEKEIHDTGGAADLQPDGLEVLAEGGVDRAAVLRKGPWFVCLSAYTGPVERERWHQDRQNLVSVWHEKAGLLLGGGNTKLQALWSTFCVGDASAFHHRADDTNPDFMPPAGLFHLPSSARLVRGPDPGLELTYGGETCRLRVRPEDDRRLRLELEATAASGAPVEAHLTLLPRMGKPVETGGGAKKMLGEKAFLLDAKAVGGRVAHGGVRLTLPAEATLVWPALPHNPYRKDGRAEAGEGRIVIRIPFDAQSSRREVMIEVLP